VLLNKLFIRPVSKGFVEAVLQKKQVFIKKYIFCYYIDTTINILSNLLTNFPIKYRI